MRIKSLSILALLALTHSSVYAQQATANFTDDIGTSLVVYLLIIAVYGLYWLKQKA